MNNAFVEQGGEEVLFRFIPRLCSPLNLLAEIKSRLGVGSYIVIVLSGTFKNSWPKCCNTNRH